MHHHMVNHNNRRSLKKRPIQDEEYVEEEEINLTAFNFYLLMRRIMMVALALAWIATALFAVSLATSHWAIVDFKDTNVHDVHVEVGIWGEWEKVSNWSSTNSQWIPHCKILKNVIRLSDPNLKHYYRGQVVIGIIGLVLLILNNLFAIYTFFHSRFVFKRLCALIYVVVAGCIFVTIEVVTHSIDKWNTSVSYAAQHGDFAWDEYTSTGYSTKMAQGSILLIVLAFLAFLVGSQMQKGSDAASPDLEKEDRPVHTRY